MVKTKPNVVFSDKGGRKPPGRKSFKFTFGKALRGPSSTTAAPAAAPVLEKTAVRVKDSGFRANHHHHENHSNHGLETKPGPASPEGVHPLVTRTGVDLTEK